MDIPTLTSLALSTAALLAVLWQIARTEGLQPIDGGKMWRQVVQETDEFTDMFIAVGFSGGAEVYEAELVVWGGYVMGGLPPAHPILRADSEPIWAIVRIPKGEEVKVGLAWLEQSRIRRHPVRGAVRRDPLEPVESWERWRWHFWADPRPGRKHGRGYWQKLDRHWGRNRTVPQPKHQPAAAILPAEEIHTAFLEDLLKRTPPASPQGEDDHKQSPETR